MNCNVQKKGPSFIFLAAWRRGIVCPARVKKTQTPFQISISDLPRSGRRSPGKNGSHRRRNIRGARACVLTHTHTHTHGQEGGITGCFHTQTHSVCPTAAVLLHACVDRVCQPHILCHLVPARALVSSALGGID